MPCDGVAGIRQAAEVHRAAKDSAKDHLVNAIAEIVGGVMANRSLDAEVLAQLNLKPRDRKPTPAPRPSAPPATTVEAIGPAEIKVTAKASADQRGNARPAGVRQIAIAIYVGDAPPADVRMWGQAQLVGRTTARLPLAGVTSPSMVWVTAWYLNSRNESGPASQPTSVRVLGQATPLPQASRQDQSPAMKIAA